jgi:hypothetical protein
MTPRQKQPEQQPLPLPYDDDLQRQIEEYEKWLDEVMDEDEPF